MTKIRRCFRPHERRAAGAYPYYRLGTWCRLSVAYRDNATPHATVADAKAAATKPGKYRITEVTERGTLLKEDFTI